MIQKFDEGIIKAYKYMLIDLLKTPEKWGIHSTKKSGKKYKTEFSHYDNKTYLSLIIKYDNTVEIKINSDTMYIFRKMDNWDLIPKIIHFRKMRKHQEKNNEIRSLEDRMKKALPDDYKRAVKISKIKSKI